MLKQRNQQEENGTETEQDIRWGHLERAAIKLFHGERQQEMHGIVLVAKEDQGKAIVHARDEKVGQPHGQESEQSKTIIGVWREKKAGTVPDRAWPPCGHPSQRYRG